MKEFEELLSRVSGGFEETEDSQEYHRHDIVMEALRQAYNKGKSSIGGEEKTLDLFISEIKREFHTQNWDYLDFIKDRVLSKLAVPSKKGEPSKAEIKKHAVDFRIFSTLDDFKNKGERENFEDQFEKYWVKLGELNTEEDLGKR